MQFLDSDPLAGSAANGPFAVLAFIEAGGRGRPADAVRTRALDWFAKRFGDSLPEAARNSGNCCVKRGGRTFVSASVREGNAEIWAYWLDEPVEQVQRSCLATEALIRSHQGKVDRVGFRLLAEIPANRIPVAGRSEGLAAAIESLCDLYSTVTGAAPEVSLIRSEDQTRKLTAELLDQGRAQPLIVASLKRGAHRASATRLDANSLAKATNGLARVCIIASSQTRLLTRGVGKRLAVFNGAVRVYRPGMEKDTDPKRHQLHCTRGRAAPEAAERSWLSIQRVVAAESGNAYSITGGGLPYETVQERAYILKRQPTGSADKAEDSPRKRPTASLLRRVNRFSNRIRRRLRRLAPAWRRPRSDAGERRAIDRLNRRLRQASAARKRLEQKLRAARKRNEETAVANRTLKDALRRRDERIAELEAALAATKPLPDSWEHVVGWCDRELVDRLMLTLPVRRDLPQARYEGVGIAAQGLKWLATTYRDSRLKGRGGDLRGPIAGAEGLRNERCGSDSFAFKWQGKSWRVQWHLRRGTSRDPRHCLRIYYFWDPRLKQVVIASMPGHRISPD